jgi:sensor histidine kinase YesM
MNPTLHASGAAPNSLMLCLITSRTSAVTAPARVFESQEQMLAAFKAGADELIGDLSDLLRLSLLTTDHEVPLARELELLDRYLAIEQTRLGERLRVVREIEPAALPALVPTFVLQPLAENAIRHGLEPKLAGGSISVQARQAGSQLFLAVTDTGVGCDTATPLASGRGAGGFGLAQVRERLRTCYGDQGAIEIVALPSGGTRVSVRFPLTQGVPS